MSLADRIEYFRTQDRVPFEDARRMALMEREEVKVGAKTITTLSQGCYSNNIRSSFLMTALAEKAGGGVYYEAFAHKIATELPANYTTIAWSGEKPGRSIKSIYKMFRKLITEGLLIDDFDHNGRWFAITDKGEQKAKSLIVSHRD